MVNKTILKNKGFSQSEINLITKHFKYLYSLYFQNENNIIQLLEYINTIQKDVNISFINSWVFKFDLLKSNKNVNIDLLSSNL